MIVAQPTRKRRFVRRPKRLRATPATKRRRPINVLASLLTCCGLYCGVLSIFASIETDFQIAAYWILAAIVFDMLDGTAARVTNSVSEFGKELDSLCDVTSFGVAPSVLIYIAYISEDPQIGPIGSLVAVVYVICGALRLARYNTYQARRSDVFFGLPIPGAAGTIAAFVLFANYFEWNVAFWVLSPMTVGISFLMVSSIEYPKHNIKMFLVTPRAGFRYLVIFVAGIAIFHYANQYHPSIVLFPMAVAYVVFGIANDIVRRFRGLTIDDGLPEEEIASAARTEPAAGADQVSDSRPV